MTPVAELKRFPESASACLVKGMLAQEGIHATVHRVSRYAGMGGAGYVLRVATEDLERARKLITQADTGVDMDEYVDPDDTSYRRCPQCASVVLARKPLRGFQRLLVLATFGIGYFYLEKVFRCTKCTHIWRSR